MDWETNRQTIRSLWPAAQFNEAERAIFRDSLEKLDQPLLAKAIAEVKKKYWAEQPQLKWFVEEFAAQQEATRQAKKWETPQPWQVRPRDTFRCKECLDTGMVRVYARTSVRLVKDGKSLRRSVDLARIEVEAFDNAAAFPVIGEGGVLYHAKDTKRTYRFHGVYREMTGSCAHVAFVCCTCHAADDRYGKWDPPLPRYSQSQHCALPPPPYSPSAETIDADEARIMEWLDATGGARCGEFTADSWAAAQF